MVTGRFEHPEDYRLASCACVNVHPYVVPYLAKEPRPQSETSKTGQRSAETVKQFENAKKKKQPELWDEWWGLNSWEFDSIDAEIKHNDTRDLLDRADSLYLPRPGYGEKDKWLTREDLDAPPGDRHWHVLTREAMTELRTAIRKEERERRETVESRLKIVGALVAPLTGFVGAVIGLIAIWKK